MLKKRDCHMIRDQRSQIQYLKSSGMSQRKSAKEIGASQSTISREIVCNSGDRGYAFRIANEKAVQRRSIASRLPKKMKGELETLIIRRLLDDWSPEQIAGRLKL